MTVHDIRHKLTKLNRAVLLIREISTQPQVINMLDALIVDICSLGDNLEKKK
jgi:hypothetical protein